MGLRVYFEYRQGPRHREAAGCATEVTEAAGGGEAVGSLLAGEGGSRAGWWEDRESG